MGDITKFVPDSEADIAVLEEPEHLTWYFHGKRWTDKFQHVVGIIHTNYLEYIKREKNGVTQAAILEHFNKWLVRAYCHKVCQCCSTTARWLWAALHGSGCGQHVVATPHGYCRSRQR